RPACEPAFFCSHRIHHKSLVERSQTSAIGLRLYCPKNARGSKLGGSAAALLGIPRVSPQAGERYPQSAGRARYMCGDADRRRKVAVLPASGGDFGEDGGGGFSADRAHAGPGGATGADGHSGGGDQQLSKRGGAAAGDGEGRARRISAALSFAGAALRGKYL